MKKHITSILIGLLGFTATQAKDIHTITIHPEQEKQTILGMGFEIQSDSIGSGNNGLPEEPIAVPHDLVQSERDRLATEMLAGFRYCRLAGGLYWRGQGTPDQKTMSARWPTQLEELRDMIDKAGVEGVSFEYWSPAPFWKTGKSYMRAGAGLRCFSKGFKKDPEYKGDIDRFLSDFAEAVVTDIQTLEKAGIKTSMFGLQNEPHVGHGLYPTCVYKSPEHYLRTFKPVATAIRAHDPEIMIFADTNRRFPKYIAPGMKDPEIAALVDAYVVHTIGAPSHAVQEVHKSITKSDLPKRPWFQNEYEYLTGGATPARCLNTVQHIMNSFQIGENPTWFWLHALKPFGNSEGSGFSLGFWHSRIQPQDNNYDPTKKKRWGRGPELTYIPEELKDAEYAFSNWKPGEKSLELALSLKGPHDVYLISEKDPERNDFEKTDLFVEYGDGKRAALYKSVKPVSKRFGVGSAGQLSDGSFAPPYGIFFVNTDDGKRANVLRGSANTSALVFSKELKLSTVLQKTAPGHWVYNDYNWNAVGSFAKRMPWNSVCIGMTESKYTRGAKAFIFKKPNGKLTFVLSNSSSKNYTFKVDTNVAGSSWKGHRFTPFERGEGTMGVPLEIKDGEEVSVTLPPQSWEFWDEV